MSRIKAVIFDMDGVIIDSEPAYNLIEKELFKILGISVTESEHHSYAGIKIDDMWEIFISRYELDLRYEDIIEIENMMLMECLTRNNVIKAFDGVADLFRKLKSAGFRLAVATSSPAGLADIVMTGMDIKDCFDVILSCESVRKGKPAPDIFLAVADKLGVRPESCLVVEDSSNGIHAAKNAGMICISFNNKARETREISNADYILDKFDIPEFFSILNKHESYC